MKKKNLKKNCIIAAVFLLALFTFIYGFFSGAYKLSPYNQLHSFYEKYVADDYDKYEKIDGLYMQTDASSLIDIKSKADIEKKRSELISYIWANKDFPKRMPDEIENGIQDKYFDELKNLESIDKITIKMDYGIDSVAYHFIPKNKNNKLMVYHQGHEGFFIKGKDTIQFFLEKGYSVIAFAMPLYGLNSQPEIDTDFGRIKFFNHNQFAFIESNKLSPIKFFVEPIVVSLNYIEKNYDYDSISMIGISGGGWTATLYAAIDPRVQKSYPVAGTLPVFLRSKDDSGDYEYNVLELYRTADYLELYILGSYGDGRKQLQVLNKYDDCCYYGIKHTLYEDKINEILKKLNNGSFDVYLDESHKEHKISDEALRFITKVEEN